MSKQGITLSPESRYIDIVSEFSELRLAIDEGHKATADECGDVYFSLLAFGLESKLPNLTQDNIKFNQTMEINFIEHIGKLGKGVLISSNYCKAVASMNHDLIITSYFTLLYSLENFAYKRRILLYEAFCSVLKKYEDRIQGAVGNLKTSERQGRE